MGWWHDLWTPSSWVGPNNGSELAQQRQQAADAQQRALAAQTDALNQQTVQAKAAADAALAAQTQANLIAAAAANPQNDSEGAVVAAEDRKRKLMGGSSFGIGLPTALGAPPVGFRLLSGQ